MHNCRPPSGEADPRFDTTAFSWLLTRESFSSLSPDVAAGQGWVSVAEHGQRGAPAKPGRCG